jgi:hypothetical protein
MIALARISITSYLHGQNIKLRLALLYILKIYRRRLIFLTNAFICGSRRVPVRDHAASDYMPFS